MSLGNSDLNIEKLFSIYLNTIDFGVLKENGKIKAYGAGIQSSAQEMQNMASGNARFSRLNPFSYINMEYSPESIQNEYFLTDSLKDACDMLIRYVDYLPKPFKTFYDFSHEMVHVDRTVIINENSRK
mmetsp:Transcript_32431/g.29238  ORF Transcript_32431/g.29238 Transcript_32431/m.29238 type:complete len:128 (-) Transcript_32431:634-1017(-)